MPEVVIQRPGTRHVLPNDDTWTFNASRGSARGIVTVYVEHGASEDIAADVAKRTLESNPSRLEGILSAGGGGGPGTGGGGDGGGGGEGGGGFIGGGGTEDDNDPPETQTPDGT